jgi:alkylated DNA repair protein alkB family protein 6
MPAIDFKALFNEERERRKLQKQQAEAGGTSTSAPEASRDGGPPPPMPLCPLAKRNPLRLSDYEIATQLGVRGLHYIPDFITEEEERSILRGVYAAGTEARWVQCGQRRVQNWGGKPGDVTVSEDLPPFAAALVEAVMASQICDHTTAAGMGNTLSSTVIVSSPRRH